MSRRSRDRAIRRAFLAAGVLLLVGSLVRLPLLVTSAGPTFNTIGEVDGTALITIEGTQTYATEGNLDMTTVSERGGSSGGVHLGSALVAWVLPSATVVTRETYYPPDASTDEVSEVNQRLFTASQSQSIAAALAELEVPTTPHQVVAFVEQDAPADGLLRAGDVIESIDGTTISSPEQVRSLIKAMPVGHEARFVLLREPGDSAQPHDPVPVDDRERVTVSVTTATHPRPEGGTPQSYVGVGVATWHEPPFQIEFHLDEVAGPSAGLMFSLGIVDLLTPGAITSGGHVAGTGTITEAGAVGPIGGIRHKLVGAADAGARLFVAPVENCDEVVGNVPDGLAVAAVSTLDQARAAVESWAADPGAALPQCPS